jgi:hypothetical protein
MNALSTTTNNARRVGQLSFDPVIPARPGHLLAVYVSDPAVTYPGARNATFVYDYPPTPDFPDGGQVIITEGEDAKLAVKNLQARAASSACTHLITLHGGQPAYQQVTDQGYGGRVTFVRGEIVFNIEGPRVARSGILAVANGL